MSSRRFVVSATAAALMLALLPPARAWPKTTEAHASEYVGRARDQAVAT